MNFITMITKTKKVLGQQPKLMHSDTTHHPKHAELSRDVIFATKIVVISWTTATEVTISYPESSGFLVSGGDAGRDSGIMAFLSQKIWDSGFSAHALMFRNGSEIFQKGRHYRERENRQES